MLWAHSVHLEDIKCLATDVNCEYDLVSCPLNIANNDSVFWKLTFQNCLSPHKSLSKRTIQFLASACYHINSLSSRVTFSCCLFPEERTAWRSTRRWRPSQSRWSPRTLKAARLFGGRRYGVFLMAECAWCWEAALTIKLIMSPMNPGCNNMLPAPPPSPLPSCPAISTNLESVDRLSSDNHSTELYPHNVYLLC